MPDTRYCKPGATVSVFDKASGQAKVIYTFTESSPLWIPGEDINYVVTPDGQPPQVNAPTPTPPPAPVDLMPAPPAGINVVRLTSNAPFTPKSNTWYAPLPGKGRITINGDTGLRIPVGTTKMAIFGVDFVGNGDKGNGIEIIGDGCSNLRFENGSCRNFTNGAVIQGAHIERGCVHKDFVARNWRMMDTVGAGDRAGQGWFVANVDGFTWEDCFGDKLGTGGVGPYTHFAYVQHGCKRIVFTRPFVSRAEAVGIQARGSLNNYTDPDDGDPGPTITDGVFYDCAIGVMPNGMRATLCRLTVLAGHHSQQVNTGGACAVYGSVGSLAQSDCLLISSPVKGTGQMLDSFRNAPRNDAENGAAWGWRNPCKMTAGSLNNVVKLGVTVDLSDLVARGRNGEMVTMESQKRCRAVAGVN